MRISEKFDWNDLQLLLVVSSTGYVTEAATKLGLDPTTVTRRLRRLEKKVGLKLVERIKGGVVLSEDCTKLVDLARTLARDLENTFPQSGDEPGLYGAVRVTIADFLVNVLIDDLVEFQRQNPGLGIDINESYARQSLNKRESDIAVRITEEPNDGLVGIRQQSLQFAIYGVKKFKRRPAAGWPWISWSLPQFPHDEWISEFDPRGRIFMRTGSVLSQARLANKGVGVAVLPEVYVNGQPELSNLVRIRPVWDKQSLWVLTHAELRNVPRVQQTMRVISGSLRRALGTD